MYFQNTEELLSEQLRHHFNHYHQHHPNFIATHLLNHHGILITTGLGIERIRKRKRIRQNRRNRER